MKKNPLLCNVIKLWFWIDVFKVMMQTVSIQEFHIPSRECLECKKYTGTYSVITNVTLRPVHCHQKDMINSIFNEYADTTNISGCHRPESQIILLDLQPDIDFKSDSYQMPTLVSRLTEQETWSSYVYHMYSRTFKQSDDCVECGKKKPVIFAAQRIPSKLEQFRQLMLGSYISQNVKNSICQLSRHPKVPVVIDNGIFAETSHVEISTDPRVGLKSPTNEKELKMKESAKDPTMNNEKSSSDAVGLARDVDVSTNVPTTEGVEPKTPLSMNLNKSHMEDPESAASDVLKIPTSHDTVETNIVNNASYGYIPFVINKFKSFIASDVLTSKDTALSGTAEIAHEKPPVEDIEKDIYPASHEDGTTKTLSNEDVSPIIPPVDDAAPQSSVDVNARVQVNATESTSPENSVPISATVGDESPPGSEYITSAEQSVEDIETRTPKDPIPEVPSVEVIEASSHVDGSSEVPTSHDTVETNIVNNASHGYIPFVVNKLKSFIASDVQTSKDIEPSGTAEVAYEKPPVEDIEGTSESSTKKDVDPASHEDGATKTLSNEDVSPIIPPVDDVAPQSSVDINAGVRVNLTESTTSENRIPVRPIVEDESLPSSEDIAPAEPSVEDVEASSPNDPILEVPTMEDIEPSSLPVEGKEVPSSKNITQGVPFLEDVKPTTLKEDTPDVQPVSVVNSAIPADGSSEVSSTEYINSTYPGDFLAEKLPAKDVEPSKDTEKPPEKEVEPSSQIDMSIGMPPVEHIDVTTPENVTSSVPPVEDVDPHRPGVELITPKDVSPEIPLGEGIKQTSDVGGISEVRPSKEVATETSEEQPLKDQEPISPEVPAINDSKAKDNVDGSLPNINESSEIFDADEESIKEEKIKLQDYGGQVNDVAITVIGGFLILLYLLKPGIKQIFSRKDKGHAIETPISASHVAALSAKDLADFKQANAPKNNVVEEPVKVMAVKPLDGALSPDDCAMFDKSQAPQSIDVVEEPVTVLAVEPLDGALPPDNFGMFEEPQAPQNTDFDEDPVKVMAADLLDGTLPPDVFDMFEQPQAVEETIPIMPQVLVEDILPSNKPIIHADSPFEEVLNPSKPRMLETPAAVLAARKKLDLDLVVAIADIYPWNGVEYK